MPFYILCIPINFRLDEKLELKPLDDEAGIDFIMNTWRHAVPSMRPYIQNLLQVNPSAGVYINGTPVAGVVFHGIGFIGMLYTLPKYRKKGYGQLCMKHLMRRLGEEGYFPACSVDLENHASQSFQRSLGLKESIITDYIFREIHHF